MNSYLKYSILTLLIGSQATTTTKKTKQETYTYPTLRSLDTLVEKQEKNEQHPPAVNNSTDQKEQTKSSPTSKVKAQAKKIIATAEKNPYIDAFSHVGYVFYKGIDNFVNRIIGENTPDSPQIVIPKIRSDNYQPIHFSSRQAEEFFNDINGPFNKDRIYQDNPILRNYEHIIETEASKAGIPQLLVYAIITNESRGDPNVVSNKGAVGLTQVMPSTVALYTNREVDLTDPQTNIHWGIRIYRDLLLQYGNPNLALAAYNAGTGTVDEFIANHPQPSEGQIDNFIQNTMHQETKDFLDNVIGYCAKYHTENY